MAYMAGVVDSDGYIGVHRNTYAMRVRGDASVPIYQARVQVKQTEMGAIELFHSTFAGHLYQQKPSAAKGRPLWTWQVHSAACVVVLTALLPFLRIKRDRAENALRVCELAGIGKRRFVVPRVVRGEPLVTASEAAERLPFTYESVCQAVRQGSVPSVRKGRRIYIPESYLPVWTNRGRSPSRSSEINAELEACFLRAKKLNHVGI